MARKSAAVFLDRDNTLIHADTDVGDPDDVRLIQGGASAIASLRGLNYKVVVVTNQGGVARGKFDEAAVEAVHERISEQVRRISDTFIDRYYYCPYHPHGSVPKYTREHPARKPQPGMLLKAADDLELDLGQSWMVGDQLRDVQAGRRAGVRTILLREDVQNPDPTGKNPGVTPSTEDSEWKDVPEDAVPDYIARNLVEAVRIIAQQRRPESFEDQRTASIAASKIKRWEPVPLVGSRGRAGEEANAANAEDAEPAGTSHAVHVPPRPPRGAAGQPKSRDQSPPLRPSGVPGHRPASEQPITKPSETSAPVAEAPSPSASTHTPPQPAAPPAPINRPAPSQPAQPPPPAAPAAPSPPLEVAQRPAPAAPAKASTGGDRDDDTAEKPSPRSSPESAEPVGSTSPDSPQREHLLRQILQELRNHQAAQAEFSTLQTVAVVLQVIAAVCLVGALWMGAAEIDVFVRWIGAGIMVQLAAITLLIVKR